jgi:galactokinase
MSSTASKVKKVFSEKFSQEPHVYFSPGRINLIGEHVDYNDGFVMPAAIDKIIIYAVALNNTDEMNFYADDFDELLNIKISDVKKMDSWKNYVLGVVKVLIVCSVAILLMVQECLLQPQWKEELLLP